MLSKERASWTDLVPATLVSILIITQIVVGIYYLPDVSQLETVAYLGAGLYGFSGLVLGLLPVFELRRKGGVRRGNSYIHTTQLVDTGTYAIVRHPQYVTFMLWAIAGMLLFQHWLIILLGIPVLPLSYIDLVKADEGAIEKFGEEYKVYMTKVPRANFVLGLIRRYIARK
jgi:protein-S-isoprenylcysteine O-methyltransferase Ste14